MLASERAERRWKQVLNKMKTNCRMLTGLGLIAAGVLSLVVKAQSAGAPMWDRVAATHVRISAANALPWAGEFSPISSSVLPALADRDTNVTIRVTIANPAPSGGVAVSLSNNDPQQFSIWKNQLTVPAGSNSGTVTVRTSHWSSGSLVTITATSAGVSVSTALQTVGSIIAEN